MRAKLFVGTAAIVSLITLAACEEQNTTVTAPEDSRVATAPAQPGATGTTAPGSVGTATTNGKTAVDSETQEYVQMAAMGDMFEVEAGKMAAQRATSADVKEFAQEMVDAHTMHSDELKSRLVRAGLIVETPAALDGEHREKLDDLRAASNQSFDNLYIDQQKEAHDEALALHRDYAMSGTLADLKAFAADTVPKVEMHRQMLTELEADASKTQKNAAKR